MSQDLQLSVNDRTVRGQVEPRTHLADYLRESHNLTGTHLGCEHGVCGACTVELNGVPVRSCITFAAACEGAQIRTVEGYDDDPVMDALRAAFSRHHALQCGYCTPGMLITARDIVRRLPGADETRIREELSGNLCRCTGYAGIVEAIRDVLSSTPGDGAVVASPAGEPVLLTTALPRAEARRAPDAKADASDDGPQDNVHRVTLDAAPPEVWRVLRDPSTAVRCMPGAELTSEPDASPLTYRMAAAVGPMKATFEGTASVRYDDGAMSGSIDGEGRDQRSRSTARGQVQFTVSPTTTGSEMTVKLDYAISGPLAQFSRGAVVDAVVEQMVERFARNVAAAASGRTVSDAPVGGVGLVMSALLKRLRSWFGF
jgi:carbon-monoxide dehydrogenase small subunit